MTRNENVAKVDGALADPVVNYYRAANHHFGMSRSAAERLLETAGVVTFKFGRERYVRKSEFARIIAEAERAEAAKSAEAA